MHACGTGVNPPRGHLEERPPPVAGWRSLCARLVVASMGSETERDKEQTVKELERELRRVTIDRTRSFIIVKRTALPSAGTTRKPLQRGIGKGSCTSPIRC